jgi:Methyltransferase domain
MPQMTCCAKVRPENSARLFHNPAPILKKPRVQGLLANCSGRRVLELGGGCLRNALYLQGLGFTVSVLEVGAMEARFPDQYRLFKRAGGRVMDQFPGRGFDVAIAAFVIETICEPATRIALLAATQDRLTKSGFLVLSVRGPRDLVTAGAEGKRCSDGFITPNLTFARSYTPAQLQVLLNDTGFPVLEFLHKSWVKAPELVHAIAWKQEDHP